MEVSMSVRSFDCSPNLTRSALAAMLALSSTALLGCPGAACPTGTIPTPEGRCIEPEVADAGLDAAPTSDVREADAWAPDAFLELTDGCVPVEYWQDSDGDTYGNRAATAIRACTPPVGYSTNNLDCNDTCATCHPGGTETCDALDNNCDASVDEGLLVTLFRDSDADSFGSTESMSLCPGAVGWVEVGGDCDDTSALVRPDGTETCNGVDDNCAGGIDEGLLVMLYRDMDGDTFGAGTASMLCPGTSGWVATAGDCNDAVAAVRPGATEACNSIDDNCVGGVDEGLLVTLYRDTDGDSYGSTASMSLCPGTSGWTPTPGDCNDAVASIRPGATEVCNSVDDNCNVLVDEGTTTWGLPTTRAVSEYQVEIVQNSARTEAFTITSRAGGIYAQRFSSAGVAGTPVLLRSSATDEFSGAISGTTLYLATLEGNVIVGTRFSTADLSQIGTAVTLLDVGEFAFRLRVLAGTSNVGVAYVQSGNSLYYVSRSLTWSGSSAPVNLGGTDREYDAVVGGGTTALIVRNTSTGPAVQSLQLNGTFDGTVWSAGTGANSRNAQIELAVSESSQLAVGVLYHHDPAAGDEVRLAMLEYVGGLLSLRGQTALVVATPFSTTLDGAMDLASSGARSFTASWLTASGTTWQYADVRIPGTGGPSLIGTVGSISLGTATTSMAIGGFTTTGVLALHGRSGTARTWFRGCP